MSRGLVVLFSMVAAAVTVLAAGMAGAIPLVPSETPDDTWHVTGTVFTSALSDDGETLYVGGRFTRVRENPPGVAGPDVVVSNVAAIDVDSGDAVSSWTPKVTGDGAVVRALEVQGDTVFIGGNFSAVTGPNGVQQPRKNLAAVDAVDGSVEPFAPQVTKTSGAPFVYTLLAGNGKLYAGGFFNNVDGKSRTNLAAFNFNPTTGTGALDTTWKPKVSNQVKDLEFASDKLSIFVAGAFANATGSNGQTERRESVARFETLNGNLHPWKIKDGVVGAPQQGWSLVATPTRLYGGFGAGPNFAAAFRLDNGNDGTQVWRQNVVGNVQTVALSPDKSRLLLGGHFGTYVLDQKICGNTRDLSGLVSVDLANPLRPGNFMCDWVPELEPTDKNNTNGAWTITTTGSKVWVGGGFTRVSDVDQRNLARFEFAPPN
jgi:hypothetical protein